MDYCQKHVVVCRGSLDLIILLRFCDGFVLQNDGTQGDFRSCRRHFGIVDLWLNFPSFCRRRRHRDVAKFVSK